MLDVLDTLAQGEYWDDHEDECQLCSSAELHPEGLECDEQGTLLETLPLSPGYWRATPSTTVREGSLLNV